MKPLTYAMATGQGTPGTIMTYFLWDGAPRGNVGAGMLASVSFAIVAGSIDM